MQEKLILRLTFNAGLALTGFRATRPGCFWPIFVETFVKFRRFVTQAKHSAII